MEFPIHWLIILVVVLILFGGRKIPELMRGFGEGVRGFRDGMAGNHPPANPPAPPAAQSAATEKPAEEKKS
ncbi:MAG TPA: twin-arginine translocase TatA/TatE family subunit [Candidatus Dormibacteraeota bacterium]|nr:twin-arginine translocase TatA/TatE family subunit [Candidatus Dormibacteraeota bacterium]